MGIFDFFRRSSDPDAIPNNVSAERAIELVKDGAILVDVREKHEWKAGHAREAIHIPLGSLSGSTGRIRKGKHVFVVCASGMRSKSGAAQLRAAGFPASSIKGGMAAWQHAGGSFV
ncbi:MAG TPA: rhodanese-like domain-containing protein [Actinomycetales bacterium]|nr:rhodanese-like domain-containing protein [Actinomycetales bacterium]